MTQPHSQGNTGYNEHNKNAKKKDVPNVYFEKRQSADALHEYWAHVFEGLKQMMHFDKALLYLQDEKTNCLYCETSYGMTPEEIFEAEQKAMENSPGWVYQHHLPYLYGKESENRNYQSPSAKDRGSKILSPIVLHNHCFGVLEVASSHASAYGNKQVQILNLYANKIALTLENKQLSFNATDYEKKFNKSNLPIFYCDPDGNFLDINLAFIELTGFNSKQEIEKTNFFENILLAEGNRKTFKQLMSKSGFFKNLEIKIRGNDGTPVSALITISPVRDQNQVLIGYEAILQNITEKRELEEQLIQAQKMGVIGTLAGGIAHDFNNLLGGIIGCASLIITEMPEDNPYFEDVKTIFDASKKAAALTSQLLSFSRKGKQEVKLISINDMVTEILKILYRTFDRSIEIHSKLFPDVAAIEADPNRIQQAIMNICINARDAMPQGGDLFVETENIILDAASAKKIENLRSGAYVLIRISDTGTGIDHKTLIKIFKPFFTTKSSEQGSGLGLSIAFDSIKSQGGMICVESEIERGTTFNIYLPAKPEKIEARSEPIQIEEFPGGTETILLVDDEEIIRNMVKRMLEKFGYNVLIAANGQEALTYYKESKDPIDLTIIDVIMPEMDGRQTFRKLKKINSEIKVLLSSGGDVDVDPKKLHKDGIQGFIQKPFVTGYLLKTIHQTLHNVNA